MRLTCIDPFVCGEYIIHVSYGIEESRCFCLKSCVFLHMLTLLISPEMYN